jgi:hypothetical protein
MPPSKFLTGRASSGRLVYEPSGMDDGAESNAVRWVTQTKKSDQRNSRLGFPGRLRTAVVRSGARGRGSDGGRAHRRAGNIADWSEHDDRLLSAASRGQGIGIRSGERCRIDFRHTRRLSSSHGEEVIHHRSPPKHGRRRGDHAERYACGDRNLSLAEAVPAEVTFEVRWSGPIARDISFQDADRGFRGQYRENKATLAWSASRA